MKFQSILLSVLLLSLPLNSVVSAQEPACKGAFSFKVGIIGGAEIDYGSKQAGLTNRRIETGSSYSFGVSFEYPVYRDIRATLSADIHNFQERLQVYAEGFGREREEELLLSSSLGALAHLEISEGKYAIRPGISIGYGSMAETPLFESTTYFTVTMLLDFVTRLNDKTSFLIQFGLFDANGGNDNYEVSGGPMTLLRAGFLL